MRNSDGRLNASQVDRKEKATTNLIQIMVIESNSFNVIFKNIANTPQKRAVVAANNIPFVVLSKFLKISASSQVKI